MPQEMPPPDVVALLVCDQIITDRLTGKQSLIGMFSKVHVVKFPTVHPQLSVFVALTEGRDTAELTIRIVDGNESRPPLVQGKGMVKFRSPRDVTHLALQFHGLTFPEAGEYRVQLWSGSTLLREAKLELVQAKPRPRHRPRPRSGQTPPQFPSGPEGQNFPSTPQDPMI